MHSRFEPEHQPHTEVSATPVAHGETKSSETKSAETIAADNLRESFLDRLCAPMNGQIGTEAREEMRQEVRAHLIASALAHEELGASPVEAMREAIQRFGNAERIGTEMRREHRAVRNHRRYRLLMSLVGGVVSIPLFRLADSAVVQSGQVDNGSGLELIVIALAIGGIMGNRVAKRRLSTPAALRWAMRFYMQAFLALFAFFCVLDWTPPFQSWFGVRFLATSTLLYTLVGAISGAITGWTGKQLQRVLPDASDQSAETA